MRLVWFENTDGAGTFGPRQLISSPSNAIALVGDIDGDGDLDVIGSDIGTLALVLSENTDGQGTFQRSRGISEHSTDLLIVFQAGEYEDTTPGNSNFDEGDWNQDGDFTSEDLIEAFVTVISDCR